MRSAIDVNCDMGEGIGNDALLMPLIGSANIACGFHAGDESTIWDTIELALKYNVNIGAHVSFLDRDNFGRNEMERSTAEIYELVTQQLLLIQDTANAQGAAVRHVKPHGALYNMSARDVIVARTIAEAVRDFDHELILFGLSGSHSIAAAREIGLPVANEVFADRSYLDDGSLVPRSHPQALIADIDAMLRQVRQFATQSTVTTINGHQLSMQADTICIHGDGTHAIGFAKAINDYFKQENIDIKGK